MRKQTDFEIELQRIDKALAELKSTAFDQPVNSAKLIRFAFLLYQRASLTSDLEELAQVDAVLDRAIELIGPVGDLYYLKANLHLKLHRLDKVAEDLQICSDLATSLPGRILKADLDFQRGHYQTAQKAYEQLIDETGSWDNLARLAYFKFKMGDVIAADLLYDRAVEELTAKEMRHYAWVELQRGVLDLSRGDYGSARHHYERAKRAYSGYWLVDEHLAELSGAQGNVEEAIDGYKRVIARVPRPDFQQALGELYASIGNTKEAEECFSEALTSFLESAGRNEVHYYHHLADFYADVREHGPHAVKWARKDVELRKNFSTLAALAWALYRAGDFSQALELMSEALSSGVKDARLFYQAGMIYKAASSNGEGDRYLQMAAEINPHHDNFHVHR